MPEHADGEVELGTAAFALRRDEDELGEGVRVWHDDHAE
jgi:hypothetical protein